MKMMHPHKCFILKKIKQPSYAKKFFLEKSIKVSFHLEN